MARTLREFGPTLQAPVWAGDWLNRDSLLPGGAKLNAAEFRGPDAVLVDVGAAGAAGGATSIPVVALSGPIPSGTLLDFGTNKFARLTANAAAGATSLTVSAIPTALVDADTAWYTGTAVDSVPSGTVVGRTIAERDAGTGFGIAVDTDDEIYIIAFDVTDVSDINDVELYRHHRVVKENFLPGWAGLAGALKTKVRSLYHCTRGAE
jgi:hypothetical protein